MPEVFKKFFNPCCSGFLQSVVNPKAETIINIAIINIMIVQINSFIFINFFLFPVQGNRYQHYASNRWTYMIYKYICIKVKS